MQVLPKALPRSRFFNKKRGICKTGFDHPDFNRILVPGLAFSPRTIWMDRGRTELIGFRRYG